MNTQNELDEPTLIDLYIPWSRIRLEETDQELLQKLINKEQKQALQNKCLQAKKDEKFNGLTSQATIPPRSGKKMIADAFATECHLIYVIISQKMIEQVEGGTRVEKIASFFEQANILKPSLLIIKDIEEIVKEDNPERDMIIDELDMQLSNKAPDATYIMTSRNIRSIPEKIRMHAKRLVIFSSPDKDDKRQFFERDWENYE
ncbi:MAG: hypothetical protein EZS28_003367 [Streblomastix strix]|uniref:ATPase AAA-type core domain-containing protein n=1 Tax=Streblomastix strix TaxID=222440 RepID=A0A5J4X3P4_9EUKA|nr:MAG: hypothetical protein EZS28_003367 [Streblomastix strix]